MKLSTPQQRALLAAHTGNLLYDGRSYRDRWYAWGKPVAEATMAVLFRQGLIRVETVDALTKRALPK